MTPHEARIYATKNAVNSLVGRGVDPENALKLGLEEGEKAFKFQTNYINNVNENAKETAKNRYTEVKEEKTEKIPVQRKADPELFGAFRRRLCGS